MLIAAAGSGVPVVLLVVALIFGFIGYRVARAFRDANGVPPWGAPPLLWGLLFLFSFLVGLILIVIARGSTERDIRSAKGDAGLAGPSAPAPPRRRRGRLVAALILFVVGAGALVGGVVGLAISGHSNLAQFSIETPGSGMVATATGAGGAQPTQVLAGAHGHHGIRSSGVVPTIPTLFLEPVPTQEFGVTTGSESAYWKVWWDGSSQLKDVVSLQQHASDTDASDGVTSLDNRNNNIANFDSGGLSFTNVSSFSVAGVPGSSGHLWNGLENGRLPIQFRFVVFSRGSVVALVSTTSYAGNTSAAAFDAFVLSEYTQMANSPTSLPGTSLGILLGVGLALILAGMITLMGARYRRGLVAGAGRGPGSARGARGARGAGGPGSAGGVPPYQAYPAYPAAAGGYAPSPPHAGAESGAGPPGPQPAGLGPPAGWYADPSGQTPGGLRYWDGQGWTDATAQPQP